MQQGLLSHAIDYYLRVLAVNPDNYEAHNNLGVAYLAVKDTEKALRHFRAALRIKTDDEAVRHTINILMQDKKITSSPPAYVRALFDSYADHFDSHLKQSLDYQVPHLFQHVLKEHHYLNAHTHFDVLDLGCGTGLCGELIRPAARSLIGVDLSEKMLAVAAQKYIYDNLIQSDILLFLEHKEEAFDLIMAGDLLVYFGELTGFFSAVQKALRVNGLFIFNAEITDEADYVLSESGRFKHSKKYLDTLIAHSRFTLVTYQVARMRTQNHQPVFGHLYLLKKYPCH
jgi:predicted TPR repeat methyltransferase